MSNLNVKDVTEACRALLEADPVLQEKVSRNAIVRATFVNENPNLTPWIGVYKNAVRYEPRTLGRHSASWQAQPSLQVLIQVYSSDSGEEAEDELEELIHDVMRVLLDNPTLNNTVDMVMGFEVQYRFSEGESESAFFQMAVLTVDTEVATG